MHEYQYVSCGLYGVCVRVDGGSRGTRVRTRGYLKYTLDGWIHRARPLSLMAHILLPDTRMCAHRISPHPRP
jgi:hypothetical protein